MMLISSARWPQDHYRRNRLIRQACVWLFQRISVFMMSTAMSPHVLMHACNCWLIRGVQVASVDLGWNADIVDAWYDYWCVYLAAAAEDLLADHRKAMDPDFLELVDRGLAMSAVDFRRLDEIRTRQWHSFIAAMKGFRCVALPDHGIAGTGH